MKRIELYNNGDNFMQTLVDTIKQGDSVLKSIIGLDQLPDIYLLQHSGLRTTGSLLDIVRYAYQIKTEDGQPVYADGAQVVDTEAFNEELTKKILARYQDTWESKFKALSVDYDIETMNQTTYRHEGTSSSTGVSKSDTDRTTKVSDNDNTSSYQGYNSTDFSPVSKTSGESTTNVSGSGDKNKTQTEGSSTSNNTGTTTYTGGDVDSRIRSRLRLRDTRRLSIIMEDLDDFLTLPIYIY